MRFLPKAPRDFHCIDLYILPPSDFIAGLVQLSMMPTHKGTVNSSLTLRPIARGCAKRRRCGSDGCRPQIRQGCEATNFRCALSRSRLGSAKASSLLSILVVAAGAPETWLGATEALCLRVSA